MKKKVIRYMCIMLSLIIVLSLLAGCQTQTPSADPAPPASNDNPESPNEPAAQEPEPATAADDGFTLVVCAQEYYTDSGMPHPNTGELSVVLTELVPEFKRRFPNVELEFEMLQGGADDYPVYLLRGAAGTLADVMMIDSFWTPGFASQGYLTPLNQILDQSQVDDIFPAFQCSYDGDVYVLVPSTGLNGVLWYRKSHVEEAGLTMPPQSWDEMREYAQKLTTPEHYGLTMSLGLSEMATVCLLGYYWAGDDEFVKEDNYPAFNNQISVDLFNMLKGIWDDGSLPPESLTVGYAESERLFTMGQASMLQHGSWLANGWDEIAPDFADDIGLSVLPPYPGTGRSSNNAGGIGWGAPCADPAKFEAVKAYLELVVVDHVWTNKIFAESGDLPTNRNVTSDQVTWINPLYSDTIMQILSSSKTRPTVDIYPEASNLYATAMQEVLLGEKDAATALTDAYDEVILRAKDAGYIN